MEQVIFIRRFNGPNFPISRRPGKADYCKNWRLLDDFFKFSTYVTNNDVVFLIVLQFWRNVCWSTQPKNIKPTCQLPQKWQRRWFARKAELHGVCISLLRWDQLKEKDCELIGDLKWKVAILIKCILLILWLYCSYERDYTFNHCWGCAFSMSSLMEASS